MQNKENTSKQIKTIENLKNGEFQAFRYLTPPEVCAVLGGISLTTLWRMERDGLFVKRVKISARRVGYPSNAVGAWLEARAANSEA